jgi:hypothetical protein
MLIPGRDLVTNLRSSPTSGEGATFIRGRYLVTNLGSIEASSVGARTSKLHSYSCATQLSPDAMRSLRMKSAVMRGHSFQVVLNVCQPIGLVQGWQADDAAAVGEFHLEPGLANGGEWTVREWQQVWTPATDLKTSCVVFAFPTPRRLPLWSRRAGTHSVPLRSTT